VNDVRRFDFRGTVRRRRSGYPVSSQLQAARPVGTAEEHLNDHKFKVGQSVSYTYGRRGQAGSSGVYKVTQLLPPEGDERQYRIKSASEPHERVVKETDIERVA
jgi:hypothetical protein